jgi:hypothetical protein
MLTVLEYVVAICWDLAWLAILAGTIVWAMRS